jgi:sporulation protein YlmC with PRC-barrel domain
MTTEPTMEVTPGTTETAMVPSGTETAGPTLEGTAGIPVTGEENPARVSNELDYNVWNQNGDQIGEVSDMVIDLDNAAISYVAISSGGVLGVGGKTVLVPWDMLKLETSQSGMTGGDQNAFVLQADQSTFDNAPDTDLSSVLPQMGAPADDWDSAIRAYWENGGAATGTGTAVPNTTGTASPGTTNSTATVSPGLSSSTATVSPATIGTTMPEGTMTMSGRLQGVALASDVIGANISIGANGLSIGTNQPGTTGTPAATAAPATTAMPETTSTSTSGSSSGQLLSVTIDDLLLDTTSGQIQYVVLNTSFDNNQHLLPVPLDLLQWDANNGSFVLNADSSKLQSAPSFANGQYPDTTADGWDSQFSSYWQ